VNTRLELLHVGGRDAGLTLGSSRANAAKRSNMRRAAAAGLTPRGGNRRLHAPPPLRAAQDFVFTPARRKSGGAQHRQSQRGKRYR